MNTLTVLQNNLRQILDNELGITHLSFKATDEGINISIPKSKLINGNMEVSTKIMKGLSDDLVSVEERVDHISIRLNSQVFKNSLEEMSTDQVIKNKQDKINEIITIDMSSPNVGKPMTMVHFRSTILGNLTSNIYKKMGAKTIKINHLGDWGIPLSSIILAVNKWGDKKKIEANPMLELDKLYKLYLQNLQINPYLEEETLQTYKKLEYKEGKVYRLWQWLRDLSLTHFNEIYDKFGIKFDFIKGESFYKEANLHIFNLIEENPKITKKYDSIYLTVNDSEILIQDIDGHSTYLARDLAAAYHRFSNFNFDKSLYFVGKEQNEHFNKLKLVLKELGIEWSDRIQHIGYSPVLLENSENETPSKRRTIIINLTNQLTSLAEKYYNVNNKIAENIAVNSLIFEALNKFRNEILTINIANLEYLLKNDAFEFTTLCNKLKNIDSEMIEDTSVGVTVSNETVRLIWQLSLFDDCLTQFLNNYESIIITEYMSALMKTTKEYIQSTTNHDKLDRDKLDKKLIQLSYVVLMEFCHLIGFKEINPT